MKKERMMRKILSTIVVLILAFGALPAQTVKVATYNIAFLDDGITAQRKANLKLVLQKLDADIIAFQEINNPAALKNILDEKYRIAMIDDSAEVQELALAVRPPFGIISTKYVFPDEQYDDPFPRSRNLLQVEVEGAGRQFVFLVHHAKSRGGGRVKTDIRREAATRMMVDYIKTGLSGKNVVLLGDFNDNPDDRSLNILEYGDSTAAAGIDSVDDTFLYNATEPLLNKDYVSYGYREIYGETPGETFDPTVTGARAENNKWRGLENYNYYTDVKIKGILFDQILVSLNLKPYVTDVGVLNYTFAIKGDESKIRFEKDGLHYLHRGSLASDHVPVWAVLSLGDNP
jgi:endonuclease/exonuclease/phosphatase family metal-dependent hydrolase